MPSVPLPGDVVADKYEIAKLLGQGGMGVVVEATHRKLGTRVAIKFLMPAALTTHDGVARFDREARASALLRSPYVVRVLDIDATSDGLPFIVMEYLQGHDLGSEIRRRGTIPVAEAIDWVLQACIGLAEAHARGIVHRDIKPANLYLCSEPTGPIVKVMDFGVSKLLAAPGEVDLTTTETTVGTPSYMAPEQLLSSKGIDHRADIWALGVVLYRMLCGSLPFAGVTPTALAIAIATTPPVDLATVAPNVPRGVIAAVMRALEKDPAKRHADMVAFGRALEPYGTKRVAFSAAVARMPPPHALDSSRQLSHVDDGATAKMDSAPVIDELNAGTGNAWAQKAPASAPAPRRGALPKVVLALVAVLACGVGGAFAFRYRNQSAAKPAAAGLVTSANGPMVDPSLAAPLASGEGAFAPPPATPVPPRGDGTAAAVSSAPIPSSSIQAGAWPAPPTSPARPAGRPPAASSGKPVRPAGPAPTADDPLHL